MPRFRFRFDTILRTRRTKEDHEKGILSARMAELRKEEEALNGLEQQLYSCMDAMDEWTRQERIDPQMLMSYTMYFERIKQMIAEQRKMVQAAMKKVEEQQSVVVDAMKDRKIMEKLEERDFEKWRLQTERELQKTMDEMATKRFFKGREDK